jgi:hypothetical protein
MARLIVGESSPSAECCCAAATDQRQASGNGRPRGLVAAGLFSILG